MKFVKMKEETKINTRYEKQSKICETYNKVKNMKYAKEVFGGIVLTGSMLTSYYLYKEGLEPWAVANCFTFITIGLSCIMTGLVEKIDLFDKDDSTENLEKKVK